MTVIGRQKQPFLFVGMSGFTSPGQSARYDFEAPEGQRFSWYSSLKVNNLNPDEFEAQQVSIIRFVANIHLRDTLGSGTGGGTQRGV